MKEQKKSPEQVAAVLKRRYREPFGGKKTGKYRFSRRALLVISGCGALREAFVEELKGCLLDLDYYLLDLRNTDARSDFALVSVGFINNLRPLTKKDYLDDAHR